MISRNRGGGLSSRAIALGLGIWIGCGITAGAHEGSPEVDGFGRWGQYGHGPHFFRRGTMRGEFGPPFFTHGMCFGARYEGPPPTFAPPTYGNFGAFTGATAFPDTIAPNGTMLYGSPGRVEEPSGSADLTIPVPAPLGRP